MFIRAGQRRLQAESWHYLYWHLIATLCSSDTIDSDSGKGDSRSEAMVTSPTVTLDHIYVLYFCHYYISKVSVSHGHFITLSDLPMLRIPVPETALNYSASLIIFQKTIKALLCALVKFVHCANKTGVRHVLQSRLTSN